MYSSEDFILLPNTIQPFSLHHPEEGPWGHLGSLTSRRDADLHMTGSDHSLEKSPAVGLGELAFSTQCLLRYIPAHRPAPCALLSQEAALAMSSFCT